MRTAFVLVSELSALGTHSPRTGTNSRDKKRSMNKVLTFHRRDVRMRTLKKISELAHLRGALRPLPGGVRKGPGAHSY